MKRWTCLAAGCLAAVLAMQALPMEISAMLPIVAHADEADETVTDFDGVTCTKYTQDDIIYYVYDDHVDVSEYIGSAEHVVIPEQIKGLPVTGMRNWWDGWAFHECSSIRSLTLPDTMTDAELGDSLSRCFGMTELLVSDTHPTYTSVDGVLFSKDLTTLVRCPCGKRGSYQVPDTVRTIGAYAFYECQWMTEIIMQKGLETIGACAFEMCCNVQEFDVPEGVVTIGNSAFRNTPGLTTLRLPSTVSDLGNDPFWDCTGENRKLENIIIAEGNPYLSSKDGVLFNADGTELIAYPGGKPGETYSVPEGVTRLREKSFTENVFLKVLYLPASLTDITAIGSGFTEDHNYYNWNLDADIVFSEDHPLYIAQDRAIYNKDMTELLYVLEKRSSTSFTVPDSVRSIGESAFSDAYLPDGILLPEGLETIGNYAFSHSKFSSITIPSTVTSIGDGAFVACDRLTSVNIPYGVKEMGDSMFSNCDDLTSVTISASVETIGSEFFFCCNSLKNITIEGTPHIGGDMLYGCTNVKNIRLLSDDFSDIESLFRKKWSFAGLNKPTATIYAEQGTETDKAAKLFAEMYSNINVLPLSAYAANISGDVDGDGDVTASDAAELLIAAAQAGAGGTLPLTAEQLAASDVNGDGAADASDAAEILIYAAYLGSGGTLSPQEYFG